MQIEVRAQIDRTAKQMAMATGVDHHVYEVGGGYNIVKDGDPAPDGGKKVGTFNGIVNLIPAFGPVGIRN